LSPRVKPEDPRAVTDRSMCGATAAVFAVIPDKNSDEGCVSRRIP
jgi:hypothetical protein